MTNRSKRAVWATLHHAGTSSHHALADPWLVEESTDFTHKALWAYIAIVLSDRSFSVHQAPLASGASAYVGQSPRVGQSPLNPRLRVHHCVWDGCHKLSTRRGRRRCCGYPYTRSELTKLGALKDVANRSPLSRSEFTKLGVPKDVANLSPLCPHSARLKQGRNITGCIPVSVTTYCRCCVCRASRTGKALRATIYYGRSTRPQ